MKKEIKVARALTEVLEGENYENLRDDIFEMAVEAIIENMDEEEVDFEDYDEVVESCLTWFDDTKNNCPGFLIRKIYNIDDLIRYNKGKLYNPQYKELWKKNDGVYVAVNDISPSGNDSIHVYFISNGTVYNENNDDVILIDIESL